MDKRILFLAWCSGLLLFAGTMAAQTTTTTTTTTTTPAQQNDENQVRLRIGPQFGYFRSRGADNGTWMVGGAARLKLSEVLGFEGSVNYRQESFRNGLITTTSWPVMVTGMLYVLPVVYGAVGAGWYNTKIDVDAGKLVTAAPVVTTDRQQRFGWHFGGGVELPLDQDKRSAFVADVRYVFINYNWDKLPGSEVNANFYSIMLGLQIGIGN